MGIDGPQGIFRSKSCKSVERETEVVVFLFSPLFSCILPEVKMFCTSAFICLSVKFQIPALCLCILPIRYGSMVNLFCFVADWVSYVMWRVGIFFSFFFFGK